jgi:HK97 family phage major capsid protein
VLTTGQIFVSFAELQDSAFDVESFIRDIVGKSYFRGLGNMITNGNSSKISSLVTAAATGATSAAPTAIAWSDIASLFGSLDPAYDQQAKWMLHQNVRSYLLGVTDTLGRPIYVPAPSADKFDAILGKPVTVNPFMASTVAATNTTLVYGDLSAYTLKSVNPGLNLVRLNERNMDKGMVTFIGFARAGGKLLQSSGSPAVQKLVQHA